MKTLTSSGSPPANPVFVIGAFRSGTSLVYALLNQHPQIALMFECDAWDFPSALAGFRFGRNWLERREFYNRVLSRHRLILGRSLHGLEKVHTPDDLYRCNGQAKNASLWGEKSALYTTRLRQLARRHPKGSFVLIWRDPMEIFRSIQAAAQNAPAFGRPGMLHRLIHQHEKMVHEAAQMARDGARIHHVTYSNLVDNTADVCRALCGFLGVDFDPRMAALKRADFSAVPQEPQHDFLRRGVIERQKYARQRVETALAQKLVRFRNRWERLSGQRLCSYVPADKNNEPALSELLHHKACGAAIHAAENCERVAYEFLPLRWMQTYRLFKSWLFTHDGAAAERKSFFRRFGENWVTILASYLFLGGTVAVDILTGPRITMAFFYLIPAMVLALGVGFRWGVVIAAISSVAWSGVMLSEHWGDWSWLVLLWNSLMNFAVLQIVIMLLNCIHVQIRSASRAGGGIS